MGRQEGEWFFGAVGKREMGEDCWRNDGGDCESVFNLNAVAVVLVVAILL